MPVPQQTEGAPVVQPGRHTGISTGQPLQGFLTAKTVLIGSGWQQPQQTLQRTWRCR